MLDVTGLAFRYPDGPPVLDGVALHLAAGRAVGLLGPNGAGKSTLLGAVTDSIVGHRSGTIAAAPGTVGPIGYATQDVALYAHLTVAENLAHAARLSTGRWRVADLVAAAVDDFALGPLVDRLARHLSGGQARLAHLACSFVHRPSVRLLDEPTTALDFATREALVALVARWREEGCALLVTAHYPEDVEELCGDLVVLVDGRTHALGPLRGYLGRRTRVGRVEHDDGRGAAVTELEGRLGSLGDLVRAADRTGIGLDDPLHAVTVHPPTLRDLLRSDPMLRDAVAEEAS